MKKSIIIIGNGTHSRVVAELATILGYTVKCYVNISNGALSELNQIVRNNPSSFYAIATGNNLIRKKIYENNINLDYPTLVSPYAYISPSAKLDIGTIVLHHAVINTNAIVGKHVIINTGAIVEHDNIIGDYSHLSPGVTLGGTVTVGNLCHLGLNSTVRNNLKIHDYIILGMGAVVTKDLTEIGTYIGIPAKKMEDKNGKF